MQSCLKPTEAGWEFGAHLAPTASPRKCHPLPCPHPLSQAASSPQLPESLSPGDSCSSSVETQGSGEQNLDQLHQIVLEAYCSDCCCYYLIAKSHPPLLQPHGLQPARLLCPWNFPGKNPGVGCHFLLQGDLPDPWIRPMSPALAGGFFTTDCSGYLT